jgi:hypothetical protein
VEEKFRAWQRDGCDGVKRGILGECLWASIELHYAPDDPSRLIDRI